MTWTTGLPKVPVSPEDRDEMPEPSSPREAEEREALAKALADNLADARKFCEGAFGPFGVDIEPYVKIIVQLLDSAALRSVPVAAGEPVAWRAKFKGSDWILYYSDPNELAEETPEAFEPLYALPPATPPSDERARVVEARQAAFQECAAIARRYDDCGAGYIIEKIQEAALFPTNAPAAEGGR